ncbi:hypothetical protein MIND_00189900 [Mycena indigotica]|uniref:Oxidoreductase AflY n=1 Tax=Mycena indigotica TaxID=2126181 RepID=A0A8H6T6Q0_9AGAR|nr:uncharacterized protein MIND_00189900 [Mycena indigotica]KAF7311794.1 hypothetical protein MIND_00189900 [Mycena indigotica]
MSTPNPSLRPGLVNHPSTPATRGALLAMLAKDAEEHHCFTNELGFHNHLPHHLVAAFDMGATHTLLKAIWDDETPTLKPIDRHGGEITAGNWAERLGEHRAYGSYYDFFKVQLAQKGASRVLAEYVLAPEANAGKKKMFGRFLAGAVHPLLQVGFGLEFGQDNMVAAGLAMAALTAPDQPNYFLDATTGLPERLVKPVEGTTLLQLLQEVYDSDTLTPIMPYKPDALLSTRFKDLAADPARGEAIKAIYSKWALHSDSEDELNLKINECLLQATLLVTSTGKAGRPARLDFFLMHALTSALCLPPILRAIPSVEGRNIVLQGYARACAMYVILRGRPRVDGALIMSYPEDPAPVGWGATGPGPSLGGGVIANPWLPAIHSALHHRDAHVIKVVRTLYYAAGRMPELDARLGAAGVVGGERLDGSVWVRAAGLVSKRLGWVAFGEKEREWDRSAHGWEAAWEGVDEE